MMHLRAYGTLRSNGKRASGYSRFLIGAEAKRVSGAAILNRANVPRRMHYLKGTSYDFIPQISLYLNGESKFYLFKVVFFVLYVC